MSVCITSCSTAQASGTHPPRICALGCCIRSRLGQPGTMGIHQLLQVGRSRWPPLSSSLTLTCHGAKWKTPERRQKLQHLVRPGLRAVVCHVVCVTVNPTVGLDHVVGESAFPTHQSSLKNLTTSGGFVLFLVNAPSHPLDK